MDQSASVFGTVDHALLVSFEPKLSSLAIQFPNTEPELTFLVAQTFVQADKALTAPVNYNLRVVECSIAADILAKNLELESPLPEDASPLKRSLRAVQDLYFDRQGTKVTGAQDIAAFKEQLREMLQITERALTQGQGYTEEEVCYLLEIDSKEFKRRYVSQFPIDAEKFLLKQRTTHVFLEALRVLEFVSIMQQPPETSEKLFEQLGSLMEQSQRSCKELFQCSCPELDELCQIARHNGSYGSRLTGAGWGGCSSHLVPADKVEHVISAWKQNYYSKRFPEMTDEQLASAIIASKPGGGSCYIEY
jgi:galactokinase